MKVIFSRKGFDGSAGGCPSPIIDGDRYEIEEHRYWTECPSNAAMCWVLCWTWTAKESDVMEFCNTLVCCSNREPSLHQKELIKQSKKLLVYSEFETLFGATHYEGYF